MDHPNLIYTQGFKKAFTNVRDKHNKKTPNKYFESTDAQYKIISNYINVNVQKIRKIIQSHKLKNIDVQVSNFRWILVFKYSNVEITNERVGKESNEFDRYQNLPDRVKKNWIMRGNCYIIVQRDEEEGRIQYNFVREHRSYIEYITGFQHNHVSSGQCCLAGTPAYHLFNDTSLKGFTNPNNLKLLYSLFKYQFVSKLSGGPYVYMRSITVSNTEFHNKLKALLPHNIINLLSTIQYEFIQGPKTNAFSKQILKPKDDTQVEILKKILLPALDIKLQQLMNDRVETNVSLFNYVGHYYGYFMFKDKKKYFKLLNNSNYEQYLFWHTVFKNAFYYFTYEQVKSRDSSNRKGLLCSFRKSLHQNKNVVFSE